MTEGVNRARESGTGAQERLRLRLLAAGVAADEVDRALQAGKLGALALDRLLFPAPARFTREQVAELAHVSAGLAVRLWRALGFTDVAGNEAIFTEADVDMLATAARYIEYGVADEGALVQLTRVLGSSMARLAEAQMAVIQERLAVAGLAGDEAVELALAIIGVFRKDWEKVFVYAYLRHLQAVANRATFAQEDGDEGRCLTVGFVDLVGFTVLSQHLDERELASVIDRFEELAYDCVNHRGGRVVKMVGDEVMFVSDEVGSGAEIALDLAEAAASDERLSDVRVSLATGSVVAHEGDYFGTVVNLASRIVGIAYAGSVVVSDDVHQALVEDARFAWKPIRPRRLKGFGYTPLWVLTRGDASARHRPRRRAPSSS